MARLGRINADEAVVRVLPKNDELAGNIVRTPKYPHRQAVLDARRHGLYLSLAHTLFPENFPKPIASRLRGSKPPALISHFADTSLDYQKAVKEFYAADSRDSYEHSPAVKAHYAKVYREAARKSPLSQRIFKAGITVQDHPVNIGFKSDGVTPVFFEVAEIDSDAVLEHLDREGVTGIKRRQVEGILARLEQYH
ncbi:hypothetical protein AUJ14_00095 [Candidatus Micrarchaeota archaeon CG1_02_55_22]|nr:MAG: hypothetical protein AUJ14_00095 [Candidatus Micrarchaeota archaeon CG1_02_55_22]